jgi:hypothetical protein
MWTILNPAFGWAQSAPASDSVLRAAYCLGVLDAQISIWKATVPPAVEGCAPGVESKKQCLGTNGVDEVFAEIAADIAKASKQKRRRYAQYLASQLPNLDTARTSILAVIAKGKTDFQNAAASASGATADMISKCGKTCGDGPGKTSQCSIERIAQQDQVLANITNCTARPDQLPF